MAFSLGEPWEPTDPSIAARVHYSTRRRVLHGMNGLCERELCVHCGCIRPFGKALAHNGGPVTFRGMRACDLLLMSWLITVGVGAFVFPGKREGLAEARWMTD